MSDEQVKQTEVDPCEQSLRDHAAMIERSCPEKPQLVRRIKRLRKAADRIAQLNERVGELRDTMQQVKLEMLAEDGEVPATDDDWTMLHGWIVQIDQALAKHPASR